MHEKIELLDVVALLVDLPEQNLVRGQVGTVVERLRDEHFEIEFSDDQGHTYATVALPHAHLMRLHHQPIQAA
jgi:hypothetical protein